VETADVARLVLNLLVILLAGLAAGIVCKRFGLSVLVGYLVVGTLLGNGRLLFGGAGSLIVTETSQLHYLAQAGALLLLFSIGLEFSLAELARMGRFFFLGGALQMLLVAVPMTLAGRLAGQDWCAAMLVGMAAAFSSTILVYKALEEFGETETPHGRRAIAILLFQDVALVPLVLLVPLLTGEAGQSILAQSFVLAGKSALFVAGVLGLRLVVGRWLVHVLASLRSTELVVLFALTLLGGAGMVAHWIGLPPALGAFAAGLVLNGNRLSAQIDALVLPYRETFSAVFFVSLGTLMQFSVLAERPLVCLLALVGLLLVKTVAAAVSLRVVGLPWRAAAGMGFGLSQLGEFSFFLLAAGAAGGLVPEGVFNVVLLVAIGTLVLTPQLLKTGLRWTDAWLDKELDADGPGGRPLPPVRRAVVIGLGPIGAQVASRLETTGVDPCLVDLSPVNLHPYAQQGFHTVAGDATDPEVLRRACMADCSLAVVTVPKDQTARQIVAAIRRLNRDCRVLVRCRYQGNLGDLKRAGADAVISEEAEASARLLRLLESLDAPAGKGSDDRRG
jgi:CPA2 family monovalent cation:H+ antiporter-2